MSKQFWIFLLVGLAIVGAGIYGGLFATKGAHLELNGSILKVRVLALNSGASLVVTDFRATNPSAVQFMVKSVEVLLDRASGDTVEAQTVSKVNVDNVFQYEKLIGPKYNDVLSVRDIVQPHGSVDRMVGARFELPESAINARKGLRLRIEEVDGLVQEIAEKKTP